MDIKTDLQISGVATFDTAPTIPTTAPTSDNLMCTRNYARTRCLPGHFNNLRLSNGASGSTNNILASAKSITLSNSAGTSYLTLTDFSATGLNLTQAGSVGALNGIYSQVLAASHSYHVYVISDGSNHGIWVDDQTTPTPPSGYIYWRWVSTVLTSSSGLFFLFVQTDSWVRYKSFYSQGVLWDAHNNNTDAFTYCGDFVPQNAVRIEFYYSLWQDISGSGHGFTGSIWGPASYGGMMWQGEATGQVYYTTSHYINPPGATYIYWKCENSNLYYGLYIMGYLLML